MENLPTWVVVLTSTGFATIFGVVFDRFVNRKKLSAEATKIISDAAASTVVSINAQMKRIEATNTQLLKKHAEDAIELADLRAKIDRMQERLDAERKKVRSLESDADNTASEREVWRNALHMQTVWISQAVAAAEAHQPPLRLPPPPRSPL